MSIELTSSSRNADMNLKRILVVDDETVVRKLCRRILTDEGYDVKCASSGEDAIEVASCETFHMVVTDLLMPGMDGLATFLALRKQHPDLIGILITGHGTIDTALEAMGLGFSGFIRKPFPPMELIQIVMDTFKKAQLTEENTRLKTLIPLYSLGEIFISASSREEVFHGLANTLSQQTGAKGISIMMYDDSEKCLRIVEAMGIKKDIMNSARIKPGTGIAGKVFSCGEPIILNGGPDENPKYASLMKLKDIRAAVSFPLKSRERTLGVVNISKRGKGTPFSPADVEMISVICGQAIMALENLRVMEERTEKVRMRTLFEQYVAPEVAEVLISHRENQMDVGEITDVTILFADIRNFTPLVTRIPLETLRAFLNDFFGLLTEVIFSFQGTLDKFMGDAILCFFGAPVQQPLPSLAATKSAIEMLRVFNELRETWSANVKPLGDIGLGIGISAGSVFLGNVGSNKRFDYTVIGPDVNLAQRMASDAVSGQILISETVKYELDGQFKVTDQSMKMLKGLDHPVSVYSVVSE